MTGAEYTSTEIDKVGKNVSDEVASPFSGLKQRAENSRVQDGTFSTLEPGNIAKDMTDGIVDRLTARLQEFQDGFGDLSDMLHTSASTYQGMEDDNTGDIGNIHTV